MHRKGVIHDVTITYSLVGVYTGKWATKNNNCSVNPIGTKICVENWKKFHFFRVAPTATSFMSKGLNQPPMAPKGLT